MSWRGRGRGRGRPGPDIPDGLTVAYVQQPLYPDFPDPVPFRPINEKEKKLLDIKEKFMADLKESPYYIVIPPVTDHIERYSDRYKNKDATDKKSLTQVPAGKLRLALFKQPPNADQDLAFFPPELHRVKDPTKKPAPAKASKDPNLLSIIAKFENDDEAGAGKRAKLAEEEDIEPVEQEYDEEEEEDEGDYNVFHESDMDDGGDGSGGDD
ncbi:hypothetical protein HK101_009391 [Irineochytrium annulatum]|nr:hypothetical protein HK101_009391 [Irineochytrium annulatum]